MIDRRDFLAAAFASAGLSGQSAKAAGNGLNVLFLAVDDLRPELGCYGNDLVHAPNLDQLASSSVVFQRAYCQSAVCGPSRASLLTGLRPDTTRVWGNRTHFRETMPDLVTLPQRFKQSGYYTQAIGKILHGNKADRPSWSVPAWPTGGRQAGMQYVDEERFAAMRGTSPDRKWSGADIPTLEWTKRASWQAPEVPDNALQDGQVADRAVGALRRLRDDRFFLAVGFQKPHLPFTAPKYYFDLYDPAALPVPEDAQRPAGTSAVAFTRSQELRGYTDIPDEGPLPPAKVRELIHGYYAATSYMDAQVGRVLRELESLGLADRTVVILFGDHGWHLGEQQTWAKTTNFELAARAPMMLRVPGMASGGRDCAGLVEFVDIYPTMCAACGIDIPENLEGASMLPLLEDPNRPWKKAAFTQISRPYLTDQDWVHMGYSMRTQRFRFTEWVDRHRTVVARGLYDLEKSRSETVNIADRPESAALVGTLADQLRDGWRAALP